MAAEHKKIPARVEHHSPGRIRLRVPREHRSPHRLGELRQRLEALPEVHSVEVNHRTGSILLLGEPSPRVKEALSDLFEQVEEAGPERLPEVTAVELVKGLDGQIRQVTGGRVSLRWLVPATFVGFGVRQLMAQGFTLGPLPWYVLFYYGVDAFLKLYPEHAPKPEQAGAQPATPSKAATPAAY